MKILRLIRYYNLLILIITQILVRKCLINCGSGNFGMSFPFILLVVSTTIIAASSYMINDYFDISIDSINKPEKIIIGTKLSKRQVVISYAFMNIIAIVAGYFISLEIFITYLMVISIMFFYSFYLKRIAVLGNLLVASLMGLSIYIVWIYENGARYDLVLFYSLFAFLTGFIREIVKDVEDKKGDKLNGCRTLPIVLGIKRTKTILHILFWMLLIIMLSFMIYSTSKQYDIVLVYVLAILMVLVFFQIRMLYRSRTSKAFSLLSNSLKFLIFLGSLSMIIFCFDH